MPEPDLSDYPLVTSKTENQLTKKELVDYRGFRKQFIKWLLIKGKSPNGYEGYSESVVDNTARRVDYFFRWVWQNETDGYTLNVKHEHANAFSDWLAYRSDSSGTNGVAYQTALKRYFKWRADEHGGELWDPEDTFSETRSIRPPDYFRKDEREKLRDAALNYGSIPHYKSLSPEERKRWKKHLARRFGKKAKDVTPADFERANGWKFTSLVWVSLDTGLRPIEVSRAKTSWVDTQNNVLRIPAKESAKNEENWDPAITDRTSTVLKNWIDEREQYDKYDSTELLWLTREKNPYNAQSLRSLLHRICEEAGIETDGRQVSWYTIRHSVGTLMANDDDLKAAKTQLRHTSSQTTMKYDHPSDSRRRDSLDRMG